MRENILTTYTQEVKDLSRKTLWRHAVHSLTVKREGSKILAKSYMEELWRYVWGEVLSTVVEISKHENAIRDFFWNWMSFSDSCYGSRTPSELKIAYFSGPEPENDLRELMQLGVRIENIWAFESDDALYQQALEKARKGFPLLKIFPGSLSDFLKTNHLLFDIIYLDFTGPLISRSLNTFGTLHAVFDEQALADLGILIVNSCEPDPTPDVCEFLSAYFYFQPMVEGTIYGKDEDAEDDEAACFSESASSHGYDINALKQIASKDISEIYSAFATSYPLCYSNYISPTLRFLKNSALRRQLFNSNKSALSEAFDRLSDISVFKDLFGQSDAPNKDFVIKGDRLLNIDGFPMWNFIETLKTNGGEIGKYWFNEYSKPKGGVSILEAARFRDSLHETLTGYDGLLSKKIKDEIRRVYSALPDPNGGLFCDMPLPHLWLELALNQLGAPYHANIRNHRRWTYRAKVRRMHTDAFTFDRCRSLYDSLPMIDMYGDILENLLPQMIVRCCIDAIGKEARWPLSKLYYGSNLTCVNEGPRLGFAELRKREKLDK